MAPPLTVRQILEKINPKIIRLERISNIYKRIYYALTDVLHDLGIAEKAVVSSLRKEYAKKCQKELKRLQLGLNELKNYPSQNEFRLVLEQDIKNNLIFYINPRIEQLRKKIIQLQQEKQDTEKQHTEEKQEFPNVRFKGASR